MSIQSEISRIQSNVQDTINVIQSTGVTVPSGATSDNLPGLATALANEKQDKLTGTQGQMVGFNSQGNAVAQDQDASNVSVPDTTASLYGLEDATVDQVLQNLAENVWIYGLYWWKRRTTDLVIEKTATQDMQVTWGNQNSYEVTYSDAVLPGPVLAQPVNTVDIPKTDPSPANVLKGKYFFNNINTTYRDLCYVEVDAPDASVLMEGASRYGSKFSSGGYIINSVYYDYGEWEYIQSSDRSAYPDSGISDGYEYQYLGVPFDNVINPAKIATGSYVGTGTYGANNPCTLTFDFEPKIVIVSMTQTNLYVSVGLLTSTGGVALSGYSDRTASVINIVSSVSGNTIEWYSGSANAQLNTSGQTFNYAVLS